MSMPASSFSSRTAAVSGTTRVFAQVTQLNDMIDGTSLLAGSRRLVQELLGSDLVDQITLMIFPVILGTGDRMFGEMKEKTTWRLVESRQVGPDGVLVQRYQR